MYSLIFLQVVFLNSLETCFNSSGLYRTVIRQERFETSSFFLFTSHNFVCYSFDTSLLYPKRLRSERARFQLLSDNCTSCRLQISNLNFSNFIMQISSENSCQTRCAIIERVNRVENYNFLSTLFSNKVFLL